MTAGADGRRRRAEEEEGRSPSGPLPASWPVTPSMSKDNGKHVTNRCNRFRRESEGGSLRLFALVSRNLLFSLTDFRQQISLTHVHSPVRDHATHTRAHPLKTVHATTHARPHSNFALVRRCSPVEARYATEHARSPVEARYATTHARSPVEVRYATKHARSPLKLGMPPSTRAPPLKHARSPFKARALPR